MNMSLYMTPSLLVWNVSGAAPTQLPGMVILTIAPAEQSMPELRLSPASMIGPLMMVSGMSFLRWTGWGGPIECKLARPGMGIDRVDDPDAGALGLLGVGVFLPNAVEV